MKQFTRAEILDRLSERLRGGNAVIISEVGIGIVAKIDEMAKIDLITAATPAIYRMHGVDDIAAFRPYGDTNSMTLDLVRRIHTVVSDTPVIAGIFPSDPFVLIDDVLDECIHFGVSGFTNVPSMGMIAGARRENIETAGIGFHSECAFIKHCHQRGFFTIGHAFSDGDALEMAETGADVVCLDYRFRLERETEPALFDDLAAVSASIQALIPKIKAVNPKAIVAIHGGPFEAYAAAEYCFAHTDVEAYLGSASLDRIPIEESVGQTLRDFQSHPLR